MVASSLEGVAGLGPARRERLMSEFGSLDALRQATLRISKDWPGCPSEWQGIYDHLQAPSEPRPAKGSAGDE